MLVRVYLLLGIRGGRRLGEGSATRLPFFPMKWIEVTDDTWPAEPLLQSADALWRETRRGHWLARFDLSERRCLWVLYTKDFDEIHNQYEMPLCGLEHVGPPLKWAEICLKQ